MARQRGNQKATSATTGTTKPRAGAKSSGSDRNNADNHSSSSSTDNKPDRRKDHGKKAKSSFVMSKWGLAFGSVCLGIACCFGYQGYLETRVNTPFDDQKMVQRGGLADPEMYWGTYRPGTYFGLKTRDPYSLVMGLMWYAPRRLGADGAGFRHWCELDDKLKSYGWTKHDGRTFGVQRIRDGPFELETSFVKFPGGQFGGDWTARVSVAGPATEELTLLWYTATDEKTGGWISPTHTEAFAGVRGETPGLGEFQLRIASAGMGNGTVLNHSYLSSVSPSLKHLLETVKQSLRLHEDPSSDRRFIVLSGERLKGPTGEQLEPNLIATQLVVRPPFTLDIAFNSLSNSNLHESDEKPDEPPTGEKFSAILAQKVREFDARFESTFHLREKGWGADALNFAQLAFSNMLGGIGYFYGSSRVQSKYTKDPVPYWRAPLYTAVPSRSFFPRGFLWDEGFHGLLISAWDVDIQLDILNHWFDLMNIEGWIPREQILGVEALAKVPDEFVTQRNSNANPPTFFVLLRRLLKRSGAHGEGLRTKKRFENLERLFPRLQAWFGWYNSTQRGELPGTYRWRGRDAQSVRELNPKTLASGLDDYPRASHPTDQERHLDLRCWLAYAAGVMADLAKLLGQDESKYLETQLYLSDNNLLNHLHLSPFTETYADFGLHTDSVVLKYPLGRGQAGQRMPQPAEKERETLKSPELRYVDSTFGYVSLFPMLLEILTPSNPYLGKMLQQLRDPDKLWSPFGLRSLSRTAPLYMTRNTEHDPPYWRGQIWINVNYLAVKALHHYASQPGPYRELAKEVYVELRSNVVQNLVREFERTGYVWEQYNDKTGRGSGCHPFNGWSSLAVLMMAEQY